MPRPFSGDLHLAAGGACGVSAGFDAEQPDLTLDEVVAAMKKRQPQRGLTVLRSTQHQLQKNLFMRRSKSAECRRWMRKQGLFDPARLVFIDEVRLRGCCLRGIGYATHGHWKTIMRVCGITQWSRPSRSRAP
jgi:hypothetical protein